uniref:G-patch_2 domain-containing protein n=2 Tax=Anopheles coluzzii TaxID=1518534 RepID=A0A6E8VAD7_ANOCL
MASSDGKIKFSLFSKPKGPLGKSPAANFIPKKHDGREKIDFIENNTIKTTGKQQDEAPKLLVIPLPKPNKPVIPAAPPANAGKSKQPNPQEASQSAPDGSETLEQRAAREIVEQTADAIVKKEQAANFVVPLRAELRLEDSARQSNLDDYESVPIEQFGMAMLRGMGFTGDPTSESDKLTPGPELRPKGLGLGADKTIKGTAGTGNNRSTAPDENLVMKCGAAVKIAMGKLQGKYGLIKSFDEDASRVLIEMSIGKDREWLNEHAVQLVTMQEYNKNSKVINSVKYEQYKDREKSGTSTSKPEPAPLKLSRPFPPESSRSGGRHNGDHTESSSNSDDERRKHRQIKHKDHHTHRTSSGTKKKSHKYKQRRDHRDDYRDDRRESSRSSRHRRPSSSGSDTSDGKVHKKKTKKKKRPRSRSRSRS